MQNKTYLFLIAVGFMAGALYQLDPDTQVSANTSVTPTSFADGSDFHINLLNNRLQSIEAKLAQLPELTPVKGQIQDAEVVEYPDTEDDSDQAPPTPEPKAEPKAPVVGSEAVVVRDDAGYGSVGSTVVGYNANYGSTGYNANYGSTGYNANYGSTGYNANYGSTGYNANYGSTGYSVPSYSENASRARPFQAARNRRAARVNARAGYQVTNYGSAGYSASGYQVTNYGSAGYSASGYQVPYASYAASPGPVMRVMASPFVAIGTVQNSFHHNAMIRRSGNMVCDGTSCYIQ